MQAEAQTPTAEIEQKPTIWRLCFRYGFLAWLLSLLAFNLHWLATLTMDYRFDRYGNLVVCLMLLFGHLACGFKWSKGASWVFRTLCVVWTVFGLFYVSYLSGVLFPR